MPFGNGDKPPKRTTQATHSFKYDTNSKGVKKDVGTDYISETQTTSTTNVVDGKNVYTTITSNVVVSIDADGVIDKDNVKQTVYINTSISDGEGNIEHKSSQLSGTISFSQTSPEQQAATETIATDKQKAGRSPLQDQADNINLGKDIVVGTAVGVATAGTSTTTQLVAAGVAGVGSNKLIPGITAENVKNELYRKTEELD